jgi:hypothetical protein
VDNYYREQFRSRNHEFNTISEEWAKEYSPKKEVQKEWFKDILNPVEEKEWLENIFLAKKNTAPGASGISYIIIQNSGPKAREKYLELVNLILETSIFLKK